MFIYFDESGIFANPQGRPNAVSCVAALVIPEGIRDDLFLDFQRLAGGFGLKGKEVKGKNLTEAQIDRVIGLLLKYDTVAEIFAIDIGLHTDGAIEQHKLSQGQKLVANLTDAHPPSFQEDVYRLKESLEALPNQLYVQAVLLVQAVSEILQTATLYYGLRLPTELGNFYWVFDAKDQQITPFEELWLTIVAPLVESGSSSKPFALLNEGIDYSFFEKYLGILAQRLQKVHFSSWAFCSCTSSKLDFSHLGNMRNRRFQAI